jgi:hypothetical protein
VADPRSCQKEAVLAQKNPLPQFAVNSYPQILDDAHAAS